MLNKALRREVLPKKIVVILKAGTWVRLAWLDAPDSAVLLVEDIRNHAGDVSLTYFDPKTRTISHHAVHSQVVEILGPLHVPKIGII